MSDLALDRELPVGSAGRASVGWWGVICVIATEASLFAYLLFAYFYFAVQLDDAWSPHPPPLFLYTLPAVIALILSSGAAWWAQRGVRRGSRLHHLLGLAVAAALGIAFAVLQVVDWLAEPFTLQSSEFGSTFYTITGVHMAHLVVGILMLLLLLLWSALGYFNANRHAAVLIGLAYWHFVVVVGVVVFLCLYVVPRLW
jgi:cytochrome c oxidase subunit 3